MQGLYRLRDTLDEFFTLSELNTFSFDLGIDFDNIPGQTKKEKAQELVAYCYRGSRLTDLVDRATQLKPNVDWASLVPADVASGRTMPVVDTLQPGATPSLAPEQMQLLLQLLGPALNLETIQKNSYAQSQFEAYYAIWNGLQKLDAAGDDLWAAPDNENIFQFAQLLDTTSTMVEENAIFLEEQDYQELRELLGCFGEYRLGKARLIQMTNRDYLGMIDQYSANEQIQKNRAHKQHYEQVLDRIRLSFRQRLKQSTSS